MTALMSVCRQRPRAEMFSEEGGSYLEVTATVQLTEAGLTRECMSDPWREYTLKSSRLICQGNRSPEKVSVTL